MLCEVGIVFFLESWLCFLVQCGTGTQACWCPGRILRKADRGGLACSGTAEVRPSGASDFNYLRMKTCRPGQEERVCERRGISGGRDILPALRFLTVALSLPGPRFLPFSRPLCAAGPGQERLVPVGLVLLSLSLALLTDSSCFVFVRFFLLLLLLALRT